MKPTLTSFLEQQFARVFDAPFATQAAATCLAVVKKPPTDLSATFDDAIAAIKKTPTKLRPHLGDRDIELATALCFAYYVEVMGGDEPRLEDRVNALLEMGVPEIYSRLADPRIRRHISVRKD